MPDKRAALERLLEQGMVMVHVDARRPGVRVPQVHQGDPELRLNLSYRFSSRDLAVSDTLVRCTLSFSGRPAYCELPLDAVFALTSHVTGEALVWPEAIAAADPAKPAAAKIGPVLSSSDDEEPLPISAARRGHLRLVK